MEAILRGEAKEIVDLVLALQGQRNHEYDPNEVMRQAVRQAIDGIDREGGKTDKAKG